jgi:hypothetical protein
MGGAHSREHSGAGRDSSPTCSVDESDNSQTYADKYNARALEPMLEWIQSTVRSNRNRFFKYQEVIDQLNLYSPRHGCAIIFARLVLLPAVKLHAQISDLPESLIVILNTLHLVRGPETRLVEVAKDGPNLRFAVANGTGGKDVCKYRLKSYLNLDQTWLEAASPPP